MRIAVIDLSHHNTVSPSLEAAKAAGVQGVIHKATEATGYVDEKYVARRKLAADVGMLWGAYHFMRPGQVGVQVDHFLRTAKPDDGTVMVCDYEDPKIPLDQLIAFMGMLETKLGRKPVLYCGHVLKEKLGQTAMPVLTQYRLWLAQYGPKAKLPPGWDKYWLWQYSDGEVGPDPHEVPGIGPHCDCNHFDGTDDELAWSWAGHPHTTQPVKPKVTIRIAAPEGVEVEIVRE